MKTLTAALLLMVSLNATAGTWTAVIRNGGYSNNASSFSVAVTSKAACERVMQHYADDADEAHSGFQSFQAECWNDNGEIVATIE